MAELAVLGAGPAGLMAALSAQEAGHSVRLFEAQHTVGGMAGSFSVAGQRVDLGSHRLHPATPSPLMERIRALLGPDLQQRQRNGRIRLQGRWVAFPLQPLDMARQLPPKFAASAIRDAIGSPLRRQPGQTFSGAVQQRLGPTVAQAFYNPYAWKLYGVDPSTLSVELADRRIAAQSPTDILRKVVRAARPQGRTFYYPRRGYGQISEVLAEAFVAAGGDIRLGSHITGLATASTHQSSTVTTDKGDHAVDLTISTIPVPSLVSLLNPEPADTIRQAVGALRTRAVVLVYLVLDRPQYTPFDAHYFPERHLSIARLSEPKNYRDSDDDPSGTTVLCAELPCWRDDAVWNAQPDELEALVCKDLDRVGLPAITPVGIKARRLPSVYPVYEIQTAAASQRVQHWLAHLPSGLVSLGRQGLGVPDNLHHVLSMGEAATDLLSPSGTFESTTWRAQLEVFANHVVED